jgi:hypothetical protein
MERRYDVRTRDRILLEDRLSRSCPGLRTIATYLVPPTDASLRRPLLDRYPAHLDGAEVWLDAREPGYLLTKPDRLGGVFLDRPRSPLL